VENRELTEVAVAKDDKDQQPQAAMPGMMPGVQAGMTPGMQQPGMVPGMQPGMMPQMPGMNPMMMMMQMMQSMMGGGMPAMAVDPAAMPFAAQAVDDRDKGLDSDIIRPAMLTHRLKTQEALPVGSVLDLLCLTDDGKHALGGLPKGCTMALAGPPGKGKTRSALAALIQVARAGHKVAFVVAEEGFHNEASSGRDDLCSRMVKLGMEITGLDEETLAKDVLDKLYVIESQYHKGQTWDDFIARYRYLVEKADIDFVVIDSLNMLDPSKSQKTADNLAALKTYNHEKGVTCLCVGQIRDTGAPVGGEALQHTADAVFLIEEMSLGSKEIAEQWGGKYRDKIDVIRAVKCVTTPIFPYPIRIERGESYGIMVVHESQPADMKPLPVRS
jgi:KaiC/GvpD/RAD55 family RecA-like ATPase